MLHLEEIQNIIDAPAGEHSFSEDDVARAIQALLFHQIIYEDTHGIPGSVLRCLKRHRAVFGRYFAAAGYIFTYHAREQMFTLRLNGLSYNWKQSRLRKDETIVLLALRLLLEHGFRAGDMDQVGRVESNTDELVDLIRQIGKTDPPGEGRLNEMLALARRRGAVRIGESDRVERLTPIIVMPGIRHIVPDSLVEAIIDWIDGGCAGDVFDHMRNGKPPEAANDGAAPAGDEGDEADVQA